MSDLRSFLFALHAVIFRRQLKSEDYVLVEELN